MQGAGQEYGRGGAEAGAGEEQRAGVTMMMTTKTMMMKTGHYQERERDIRLPVGRPTQKGQPSANIRLFS